VRSVIRNFRGPSVLPKTQRNRVILLRTLFKPLWGSEVHKNLKIDADALNRRRRRFFVRRGIYYICQREWREYAVKFPYVNGLSVSRINSETKQILSIVLRI